MNPNLFLADFSHIANAPEGINRLREMIYNLAVTGALSEQRPSEGDGLSLLKEIEAKKKALSDAGMFKRSLKLENLRDAFNENLPKIPSSWAWSRLVEVGEISPKNEAEDATIAAFASMSAISEMHSSTVASEDRPWGNIKKGYTHFADGDVVLAKITPCFENGKAAVMSNLTNGIGAGTTELHVVRPITGVIEPGYIYVFLRSPYFKIVGESHMTGTAGQKRLPTEYFATRPFPLPPLAEQKRIVAKVDELMALCDQLEAQQQERLRLFPVLSRTCHARFAEAPTPANLIRIFDETGSVSPNDLRKTIINFAVQGFLVNQEATDEPASDAWSRIQKVRLAAGEKDFGSLQMDDTPFAVPKGWCWIKMGNLALSSDSGWSPQCDSIPRNGTNWGVLKVSAVSWDEYNPDENKALPAGMTPRPECEVQNGDFLLSRANTEELVARSVVVTTTPPHLMMSDKIVRFTFPEELEKRYINLANSATFARSHYAKHATGTSSSMKNVGRGTMCHLPIPLPPLAEQRRIVAKVDELMALVSQLEAQLQERDKLAEAFAKACVASFTGTTQFQRPDKMKAPKTELVSLVTLGKKPKPDAKAPLAQILIQNKGTLPAKSLWQLSGLTIDAFYQQLKTEIAQGWIAPPETATMQEVETDQRVTKLGRTRSMISPALKKQVFSESGDRCSVCGTEAPLQLAHIISLNKSGESIAENLICLCANCHAKADKEGWPTETLHEYKVKPWILRNPPH